MIANCEFRIANLGRRMAWDTDQGAGCRLLGAPFGQAIKTLAPFQIVGYQTASIVEGGFEVML